MTILDRSSGTFTGTTTVNITRSSGSYGTGTVIVVVLFGNTVFNTPGSATQRTNSVVTMGLYSYDIAGAGQSSITFTATVAGDGEWYAWELSSGSTWDTGNAGQNTSSPTSYSMSVTPGSGDRHLLAVGGGNGTGLTRSVTSFSNSFGMFGAAQVSSGDWTFAAAADLNVTANGSTAYSTVASFSAAANNAAGGIILAYVNAAPPATVFPPNLEQRRRLLAAPRQLRGSGRVSTPVRQQVNPPFPVTAIKQPRQLRGKLARRGECWMPIPAQVIVAAPTYPPQPERERIKVLRQFRGRMTAPPLDQAPVPAPVHVRAKIFRARTRTEAVTPVPAQVVVNAPPYPPQPVRTRLRGLRLFRPRAAAPVPAQVTVVPPTFVPLAVRARLRFAKIFRARAAAPPVDQLLAPPGPHVRVRGIAPRRGHAAMPVPPQVTVAPPAYPVRPVRQRLKGLRQSRGHQAVMPVPPQIVIPPPPYAPVFSRLKKRLLGFVRPSTVTPVGEVCDCTTHRPNLGTTNRPGSGMTARPDSGTTGRPCSCGND